MPIATLIAAEPLPAGELNAAADRLHQAGLVVGQSQWIEPGLVGALHFTGDAAAANAPLDSLRTAADVLVLDEAARSPRLLMSDMDSTMIANECIDELADYAGVKPQVAEITERAMQGELDFEAALRERVALLKGLSEHVIGDCLGHRIQPMPGARTLVRTLRSRGCDCVLVSGGFHSFADVIGAELGFHAVFANRLVIDHGHLTGELEGAIVDAARKAAILMEQAVGHGLEAAQVIALGDGANDIPMLKAAGTGIAYHAKPAAIAAADGHIAHGDWTALLHALGIPRGDWSD
ncbi:phosphoserine phosphatase SerB [Sphingomonas sp. 35-24ZXX]|uniref:phosphoserine phosphatase SerB n=1 Tax=Sphingomonas sp. 35-24ZXX TaxID=1545915 RepID=UPI00053BDD77|nr:phosphoserine phosphatase SerB [Sphingomonas sp. 35-24ZXX]